MVTDKFQFGAMNSEYFKKFLFDLFFSEHRTPNSELTSRCNRKKDYGIKILKEELCLTSDYQNC